MLLGGLPLLALSAVKEGEELGPRLQQLTGAECFSASPFADCI